jgi:nicotinate-nucleotide adenylyltransferase
VSRRVGLFGGTFDPPHQGHLVAAQEALEQLALDVVYLMPAGEPPHKPVQGMTPAPLRLAMVHAAVAGHPGFQVRDDELKRAGPSFTVDTLRALKKANPEDDVFLILGADQWRAFHRWRAPDEIGRLATLVVLNRGRDGARDSEETGKQGPLPVPPGMAKPASIVEISIPALELSSSEIRERVRTGRSIRFLVPDEVRRIIREAQLYRQGS